MQVRIDESFPVSRRALLHVGALSGFGLTQSSYLRWTYGAEEAPKAVACIFVHLKGGPSHLDSLDMKPQAPVEEQGEFKRIQSVIPGLEICEHLPRLAKRIDYFTLIRGLSHAVGDHQLGNEYLFTGTRPTPANAYPSMGSVCAKELPVPQATPPFVAVPNSDMAPGFLGIGYGSFKTTTVPTAGKPFEVRGLAIANGLTIEKIKSRNDLLNDLDSKFRVAEAHSTVLEGLDQFSRRAGEMILSERTRLAFDVSRESPAILQMFESDDTSQAMLLAGRLVENGIRFVTVTHDGWDTHVDNFVLHKGKLLPRLDASITSLVQMLELKGLLDQVLIVVSGEFGRTPTINGLAGRDHWPRANWTLLAGGGTKRGFLYGGTDQKGHGPDDRTNLKPDDIVATVYGAVGIDSKREYFTSTGRPVTLVPEGNFLHEVFV
ncbi:MAG: DUF1501 domain-containing protein [Planctomycetes bacterium]|nr:DUF1501 domain-containing protein [Planctomycetota bacterium]